jgi:uncharacterized protein
MDPDGEGTWKRGLMAFRKEKDEFFRTDHESPLLHGAGGDFHGLKYFDPDPGLRFEVKLQRYPDVEGVVMTTSKGTRQLFNRVGYFEVAMAESQVRLQAYQHAQGEDPNLFVPFRDATSGRESYGASRYIDLPVEHDDEYALDFNYAYNPYCAYSEDYICPLPPRENWLAVPVRAGEMKYHD